MSMRTQRAPGRRDDSRSDARRTILGAGPAADTFRFTRLRRFLSYYRPHIPLLVADLACAIMVAVTALALPLCAHLVTQRLAALHNSPAALAGIYAVGG